MKLYWSLTSAVAALVMSLGGYAQSVTLHHVHGLAYSADGKRLMIPSHYGLAVYQNGKWYKAPGPQHDYMGFSATAKRPDSQQGRRQDVGQARPRGRDRLPLARHGLEYECHLRVESRA